MNARLFFILYAILTPSCSNKPEPSDNKKSNALIYNNYATSILEFEGVFPENPLILLSHSKAIRMFLSTKQKAEKINLDEGLYKFYNHWIYLTNGFNITVTLTPDNKNNRYHIRGSGKRENTILAGFIKETDAFIFSEIVFGDLLAHPINKFWEKLELFSERLRNMLLDTSLNQKFVEDQQKNINYIRKYIAFSYKTHHNKKSYKNIAYNGKVWQLSLKEKKILEDFILDGVRFDDLYLFKNVLYYRHFLKFIYLRKTYAVYKGAPNTPEYFQTLLETIDQTFRNREIKEYLWYDEMSLHVLFGPKSSLSMGYYFYKKYAKNSSFVESVSKMREDFIKQTPKFSFKDVYDKKVHLSNFKGNYVFINIWETSCKVCLDQLSKLEEIQEKYRFKPIKFVSIFFDEHHNKMRWKELIIKNRWKSIYLISNKKSGAGFLDFFKIKRFPRFILLDEEGKLLDSDYQYPTDKSLNRLLNTLFPNIK